MMFPKAKIVHCVRHPLDTCLSCYFQNFRTGQEFSFDLSNNGSYYSNYKRLMQHWHTLLPQIILDINYEKLVDDPFQITQDLLSHCNLTWDDACLKPHETKRPVTTASSQQVRQQIYQSSVGRWRGYKEYLGPLLDSLQWSKESEHQLH